MEINQYPLESFSFQDEDYYDIDFWTGSGYQSRKILGSVIKAGIAAAVETIYNADGNINANRTIDLNTHLLTFTGSNGSEQFKVQLDNGVGNSSEFLQTLAQIYCLITTSASSNVASFDLNPVSTQLKIQDGTNESRFEVSIFNSGESIPVNLLEIIFEEYNQFNPRKSGISYSTGIGLAFCKMAIEAHGGKIGVESKENEGTAFIIQLRV